MALPTHPNSTLTKVGHGLAKGLGIKLEYRDPTGEDKNLTRGESVFSVGSADTFVEQEPTTLEWLNEILPTRSTWVNWVYHLFPFTHWILKYNLKWLQGDLIAGITVGAVVVPQSMAYAKLAQLPVEFGLYSSFMGVLIYWPFGTSKDITIGPVAVMSTVTGSIVLESAKTLPDVPGHVIASALAVIAGSVIFFIGFIRCGWIVDFISLAAISAYMTGSALNIAVGQVPGLLGIPNTIVNNRAATYLVVVNTLKHIRSTKLDAALGFTALFLLYAIRSACKFGARKMPSKARAFFFLATLRVVFVILLYTMISWLVNRHHRPTKQNKFVILGTVPRGFKNAGAPVITKDIIKSFASQIPVSIIVILIEHIAIAKSFGRVNNYTIDPSQEMVAIGITNLLGPFLGAYPATGSFSRTAIKSKAGVRTPFGGVITAIVVLLAIYALPAVFFYIPTSVLSAVIIHAVGDLITPPNTVYQFWRVNPFEVLIFFTGVFVTIFASIEDGIYTTISFSAAVLLFRVVKAKGRFLGKIKVHDVVGDSLVDGPNKPPGGGTYGSFGNDPDSSTRNVFLPIEHQDGTNPEVEVESPYPGIFMYRFSEGFNYPNANHYLDFLVSTIFKQTRRTNANFYPTLGDRPWNDPGPRHGAVIPESAVTLPTLKAIILDFSSVNNVDITSVQNLIDVRNQLDRYAAPDKVDWHLACINNRWSKRALASAGFGYPTPEGTGQEGAQRWKPLFSVAELGGRDSAAAAAEADHNRRLKSLSVDPEKGTVNNGGVGKDGIEPHEVVPGENSSGSDIERSLSTSKAYHRGGAAHVNGNGNAGKIAVVHGLNLPLFHVDLTNALQSAIANAERRGGEGGGRWLRGRRLFKARFKLVWRGGGGLYDIPFACFWGFGFWGGGGG